MTWPELKLHLLMGDEEHVEVIPSAPTYSEARRAIAFDLREHDMLSYQDGNTFHLKNGKKLSLVPRSNQTARRLRL